MEKICLASGDLVYIKENTMIQELLGSRQVLSTSPLNGGYREDLRWVFNIDLSNNKRKSVEMDEESYRLYMEKTARSISLDPKKTAGLSTIVPMDQRVYKKENYRGLIVEALVTAGISNAARVGQASFNHEENNKYSYLGPGTINMIVNINKALDPGAMANALMTLTEAKVAAMEELKVPSAYGPGLATGTGTDGIILIANKESKELLTNSGKHFKLGEILGRLAKSSIKEALGQSYDFSSSFWLARRFFKTREDLLARRLDKSLEYVDKYWENKQDCRYLREDLLVFTEILAAFLEGGLGLSYLEDRYGLEVADKNLSREILAQELFQAYIEKTYKIEDI